MTLDELRAALARQTVSDSTVENMTTAQAFVKETLYNVEPITARTFIEYELREHFSMKAAAVKTLIPFQKELYKEYRQRKETRRVIEGADLPEWYEMTERGGLRFVPRSSGKKRGRIPRSGQLFSL